MPSKEQLSKDYEKMVKNDPELTKQKEEFDKWVKECLGDKKENATTG